MVWNGIKYGSVDSIEQTNPCHRLPRAGQEISMTANPFKPTAGKMPPILIGRQQIISDFSEGIDNGAGAPGRLMLITGQRGYGKTVMLTELGCIAKKKGWLVISETASSGMCERLTNALVDQHAKLKSVNVSPSIGIPGIANASVGSVSFASPGQGALDLRRAISNRLGKMEKGKGIAFTIDEAQVASREDMVALATTVQHVIRDEDMRDVPDEEKHGIAFVFAALPSLVDDLLNDNVLTFLRRSVHHHLSSVALPDVKDAYIEVVRDSGKTIDASTALAAAKASEGYPYMIQLVGYYMWRSAQTRKSNSIEQGDVDSAIEDAVLAFGQAVCAPLLGNLTGAQRTFVEAVAQDDPNPASVADIAERTGKSASWVSKYRASLIKEHVIDQTGHGFVKLVTPYLGRYIREPG